MALAPIILKTVLSKVIEKVLARDDVPVSEKDVPAVAEKVVAAVAANLKDKSSTIVPIKSDLASKINWTQVVAAVAILGSLFGFELDAQTQLAIVSVIAVGTQVATIIMRTYFTKSITASSVE